MRRLQLECQECGHSQPTNIVVPLAIVGGRYEDLSHRELGDHVKDVNAECKRRGVDIQEWLEPREEND